MKKILFVSLLMALPSVFAQTQAATGISTLNDVKKTKDFPTTKNKFEHLKPDQSTQIINGIKDFKGLSKLARGSEGVGGGDPAKVNLAAIQLLIEGDGLKSAMLNYLKTLPLESISNTTVRQVFQRIGLTALREDIQTSGNYMTSKSCRDSFNNEVPASTVIGKIGSQICFDVDKLATQLSGVSEEDAMIRLASLAFHEHIHHFQSPLTVIQDNEDEAYRVSAYVLVTAKIVQVPLLKWSNPGASGLVGDYEDNYTIRQLPSGSVISLPVDLVIPPNVSLLSVIYSVSNETRQHYLQCWIKTTESDNARAFRGSLSLIVWDVLTDYKPYSFRLFPNEVASELLCEELKGASYPEQPLMISEFRRIVEAAGGELKLPTPTVIKN